MISKDKWQKYIQKLAAIDQRAADLMRQYIEANGLTDNNALIEYAYALATKYGEASGELACEMYDLMAQAQGAMVPAAVPAETATMEEVAKGMMYGKYHSPSQIPSILGRQVRQAGADTMAQNAIRDHAEWAWVPSGDSCAFCITLASRGWQKASGKVLRGNHAEHIHANCDCTFAIAFNSKGKAEYDAVYDPDKYAEMYYSADGLKPKDRINALRRDKYQQNKEYINAQKRDAYWDRQFSKLKNNLNNNEEKLLTRRLQFIYNSFPEFIPLYTIITDYYPIAGKGTEKDIRDIKRLVETYGEDASQWKKMAGKVTSDKYIFDIHWYECDDGIVREPKIKYMKEIKKGKGK